MADLPFLEQTALKGTCWQSGQSCHTCSKDQSYDCLGLAGWWGSVGSGLRGEVVAGNLDGVLVDYWGVELDYLGVTSGSWGVAVGIVGGGCSWV